MPLPGVVGLVRNVPALQVDEARERFEISVSALRAYVREARVIWPPKKLKGRGRGYWYTTCTIPRLEAIHDLKEGAKGVTYSRLRHYLWAEKRFDLPDWTLWRDDRANELAKTVTMLSGLAYAVFLAETARKMLDLARTLWEAGERGEKARDRRKTFDGRQKAGNPEGVLMPYLVALQDPGRVEPRDLVAARSVIARPGVALPDAPTDLSPNLFSMSAVLDRMRQMQEEEATRLRDYMRDQLKPEARKFIRDSVLRTAFEDPALYGSLMASIALQNDSGRDSSP